MLIGRGDDVLVDDLRVVWNERFGNVRSARYEYGAVWGGRTKK